MKYLITGGGTGGHIYPALSIAEEIKESDKEAEILYIGTEKGLESKLVPRVGLNFETVRVRGLPRKINKDLFLAMKDLFLGLQDSKKIIKKFNPDIAIGTGGYVCGPIMYIAAKNNIPTIIHEQNAYPGITNKILSRYVDKIAITFDEAKKYFSNQSRVVNTGNPVRKDILKLKDEDESYRKLGIKKNNFTILSFGGSGGQRSLNKAILGIIDKLDKDTSLIHITGKRLMDEFQRDLIEKNIELSSNINILEYLYDMPDALNIADIVITPAGAITLAELSVMGKASILVPKAYTAENHQEFNAKFFEDMGAARVILEKDLNSENLIKEINILKNDRKYLEEIEKKSLNLGKPDASSKIYSEIYKLLYKI